MILLVNKHKVERKFEDHIANDILNKASKDPLIHWRLPENSKYEFKKGKLTAKKKEE